MKYKTFEIVNLGISYINVKDQIFMFLLILYSALIGRAFLMIYFSMNKILNA